MAVNFLSCLPSELRDEIYIYALSSSTGYVSYERVYTSSESPTGLACYMGIYDWFTQGTYKMRLVEIDPASYDTEMWCKCPDYRNLFICKQMQKEVEEVKHQLFWKYNTLLVTKFWDYRSVSRPGLLRPQHILFRYEDAFSEFNVKREALLEMEFWSEHAKDLRTVTHMPIYCNETAEGLLREGEWIPDWSNEDMEVYIRSFRKEIEKQHLFKEGKLPIKTTIDIRFIWTCLTAQEQRKFVRDLYLEERVFDNAMIPKIHKKLELLLEMFGTGTMVVNGVLCYKDGEQVADPIPLKPLQWPEKALCPSQHGHIEPL